MKKVFLLPAGEARYELYCEPSGIEHPRRVGIVGRVFGRVREVVVVAEQGRRRERHGVKGGVQGWVERVREGLVRGIVEWVSEQRLLWHLRHETNATLVFPDDLDSERAMSIMRATLRRDIDHHRVWMVVDGVAVIFFGPLFFFVPGPNLISWYFAAKTVGHWLAFQGARQGLSRVTWLTCESQGLTAVRQALTLPPIERQHRLSAVSEELQLEHLATFLERTVPA